MNVAVLGTGRMGQQVVALLDDADDCAIAGVWSRQDSDIINASSDLDLVLSGADVAIDFTLPEATDDVIKSCIQAGVPLVCGVSGLSAAQVADLAAAADAIPVIYERNMSLGVAVLKGLVEQAGLALGDEFSLEINETHHVHKKDAPSGTALLLGEVLAASRGVQLDDVAVIDGQGAAQSAENAIVFNSAREGEIAGDHEVVFRSASESVALRHSVSDRRVFAAGAVAAARWLGQQQRGLYSMSDVLLS